jgi:signal transduction histidine kinase
MQSRSTQDITALAGELRQVFSNLLVNAVEAVEAQGKVKVRIGRCTLRDDRSAVRIAFSDNGTGMATATLSRIFGPLYTTKGAVGTGLGLWVSKQIVDKHEGRIQLRSRTQGKRRGSTFSGILPR